MGSCAGDRGKRHAALRGGWTLRGGGPASRVLRVAWPPAEKPTLRGPSFGAMRVQPCKGLPGPALGRPLERRGSSRRPASRTVPQQPRAHAPGGPSAAVGEAAGHGTRAAAAPSKCPFALAADFMLQDPRPPKLSPLGEVVFSSEPAAVPTPHLWCVPSLAASQQRQATAFDPGVPSSLGTGWTRACRGRTRPAAWCLASAG